MVESSALVDFPFFFFFSVTRSTGASGCFPYAVDPFETERKKKKSGLAGVNSRIVSHPYTTSLPLWHTASHTASSESYACAVRTSRDAFQRHTFVIFVADIAVSVVPGNISKGHPLAEGVHNPRGRNPAIVTHLENFVHHRGERPASYTTSTTNQPSLCCCFFLHTGCFSGRRPESSRKIYESDEKTRLLPYYSLPRDLPNEEHSGCDKSVVN